MTTRQELKFDEIMERYGRDVLVLHHNPDRPCPNADKATGSTSRNCSLCFGLGYIPTIKKYRTRNLDESVNDTVPRSSNTQNFGKMVVESNSFFFHNYVPIGEQDLIVEVDWNGIQPIYKKGAVFSVSHVHDFHHEHGKVLYKKAYAADTPVNKHIRGFRITKQAGQIVYKLTEGK